MHVTWNDGFSRSRALEASADDAWAIRVASAGKFGVQWNERLGRQGERAQE